MKARFYLLILVYFLFFGSTALAADSCGDDVTTVYTFEELEQWFAGLDDQGGKVVLGDTITIEDSIFTYEEQRNPICIDTGAYGLIYDGGNIDVQNLKLEGEGIDVPVLEIRSTPPGGWFIPLDWNRNLSYMDVTAAGRDGVGGVAVRITSESEVRNPIASYEARGRIHSYGTDAVGLELSMPDVTNGYFLDIDVAGDGACAVSAVNGADLFGCNLSAQGSGAVTASGNDLILDTCILSSEPQNVTVIKRHIESLVGLEPQVRQNSDPDEIRNVVRLCDAKRYRLSGGRYLDVYLEYDQDQVENLDSSVPGVIDIPVSLPGYLKDLGLDGGKDMTFRIWIRDPALPIIQRVRQDDNAMRFFLWEDAVLSPGIILWCSKDNGLTWADITDWDSVTWSDDSFQGELFQLDTSMVSGTISLVLENEAGWSNTVILTPGENQIIDPGTGGDRDGGDRDEQPGSEGGEHGENNSHPSLPETGDGETSEENSPADDIQAPQKQEQTDQEDIESSKAETDDTGMETLNPEAGHMGADAVKPEADDNVAGTAGPEPDDNIAGTVKPAADDNGAGIGEPEAGYMGADSKKTEAKRGTDRSGAETKDTVRSVNNMPVSDSEKRSITEKKTGQAKGNAKQAQTSPSGNKEVFWAEMVLPVLVLCAAGIITAVIVFRKKRRSSDVKKK